MKNRTFGISKNHPPLSGFVGCEGYNERFGFEGLLRYERQLMCTEAFDDYRMGRENGNAADSPSIEFPRDGRWFQGHPNGSNIVRYTEGPKDQDWMEEKDRNYLARLEREGALREQEPEVWAQREKERIAREQQEKTETVPVQVSASGLFSTSASPQDDICSADFNSAYGWSFV